MDVDARLPPLDAASDDGDVRAGRILDLRRLPPLLLAQDATKRRPCCRCCSQSSARWRRRTPSSGGHRATACITSTSTRSGIRTTSSADSGGRTSSGFSTRTKQFDDTFANSPDLLKNPIVMWQNKWHKVILIVAGFGIPTLIGAAFGDPIAGLLWGGFLRIAVIHHTTFFVNSLAHSLGKPLFNAEVSARDNWFVAHADAGRGLPQLPPPLPDRLPQRHSLVSVGSVEVADPHVQVRRTRVRPPHRAAAADRAGAHAGGDEDRSSRRSTRRRARSATRSAAARTWRWSTSRRRSNCGASTPRRRRRACRSRGGRRGAVRASTCSSRVVSGSGW